MTRRDPTVQAAPTPVSAGDPIGQAGESPLEGLFTEHGREVFRAAYRITGNAADAEDVTQTVFLRLMRQEEGSRLGPEPTGYLRRAATNAALDVLRRRRTARAVPLEGVEERLTDQAPGPERRLGSRRLHESLRRALTALSERAATVFALRHIEGLTNGEIAELLDTSSAVVAVTLHRARRDLKKALGDTLGEPS
jgi:RNA polymerase sigma-70 factor, ECF subfamily